VIRTWHLHERCLDKVSVLCLIFHVPYSAPLSRTMEGGRTATGSTVSVRHRGGPEYKLWSKMPLLQKLPLSTRKSNVHRIFQQRWLCRERGLKEARSGLEWAFGAGSCRERLICVWQDKAYLGYTSISLVDLRVFPRCSSILVFARWNDWSPVIPNGGQPLIRMASAAKESSWITVPDGMF